MLRAVERYLDSLAGYRSNSYGRLPRRLRERIASEWRRSFQEWGYATA